MKTGNTKTIKMSTAQYDEFRLIMNDTICFMKNYCKTNQLDLRKATIMDRDDIVRCYSKFLSIHVTPPNGQDID